MLKLGIIGATGYVGEEIVRLLARRKDIEITTVVSNTFEGKPYSSVYPSSAAFLTRSVKSSILKNSRKG